MVIPRKISRAERTRAIILRIWVGCVGDSSKSMGEISGFDGVVVGTDGSGNEADDEGEGLRVVLTGEAEITGGWGSGGGVKVVSNTEGDGVEDGIGFDSEGGRV